MRRSPAEYYVRYRLIRQPEMPVDKLIEELAEELVFVPGEAYVEKLRDRMTIPRPFQPDDLSDGPSQTFLRNEQVWTMFHRHAGTREATAVFGNVRIRGALQTLIAGSVPEDLILDVAARRLRVPLSAAGLHEFVHYYWNVDLLTRRELAGYVRTHLGDEEMARIAGLPPAPSTMLRTFFVLGVEPTDVNERQMLRSILGTTAVLKATYERDLPPGPAQAAAIRHVAETALAVRDALREIEPAGAGTEDLLRLVAATRTEQGTTLRELRGGKPPVPVGLLPEDDDDGGGKRPTNPSA